MDTGIPMTRIKLQQTGDGSYYVYLPKTLIREKNLQKGDLVNVSKSRASIILSPASLSWSNRRKEEKEFEVSEKPEDLEWKIMSAYLSGCLSARFSRLDKKDFSEKQTTIANEVIQGLRGIESSINQKELEFVDIVNYDNVNLYDEVSRMLRIIRALLEQNRNLFGSFRLLKVVADSLHRHWTFEKEQINPVSFYIHRIASVQLQFPDLFARTIQNPVDSQHVSIITYVLERIGDVIFGMAENACQIYMPKTTTTNVLAYPASYIEKQMNSNSVALKDVLDAIEKPMRFFFEKNIELSRMVEDSEEMVCSRNAFRGLQLRSSLKKWRRQFDREIVDVIGKIGNASVSQKLFPIGFRLRELSTYIESLASRTCQFYYQ